MNMHHRGKQQKLWDTVIPLYNPEPAPGEEDTRGQVEKMCFPDDVLNPELRGKVKEMRIILQECKSIWDKYMMICKECGKAKPVRKCRTCSKSQTQKDAECHIMIAEEMGEGDPGSAEGVIVTDSMLPPSSDDIWCCM